MQNSIFNWINDALSWKKVVLVNLVVFSLAVTGFTVYSVTQKYQENKSFAEEVKPTPTPYLAPNYPVDPPHIDRVSAFFGKPGDAIVVLGSNFGNSQWGSKVYVSGIDVGPDLITGWSNATIEVKIPDKAQTGRVTVVVNGKGAEWDGNLIVSDPANSVEIGLTSISPTQAQLFVGRSFGVTHGLVEFSIAEGDIFSPGPGVFVTSQTPGSDTLGKTLLINFTLATPLSGEKVSLGNINYQNGTSELIRAELYNSSNQIVPTFVNPLNTVSGLQ